MSTIKDQINSENHSTKQAQLDIVNSAKDVSADTLKALIQGDPLPESLTLDEIQAYTKLAVYRINHNLSIFPGDFTLDADKVTQRHNFY